MNLKILQNFEKPFFIMCIFLVLVFSETEPDPSKCQQKSCGSIPVIKYPFWIDNQQPEYCGYPPLKLSCDNSTPISFPVLRIVENDFYVKNIFYDNHTLHLAAKEFDNNSCPVPSYNITVDIYPFSVSTANTIIFFLLNCSGALSGFDRISCFGNEKNYNYFGHYNDEINQNLKNMTCMLVTIPVVRYPEQNGNDYAATMREGWLLNWDLPKCAECRASSGTCGYDYSASEFMCMCSDRIHKVSCSDLKNAVKKKKRLAIIIGVTTIASGVFLVLAILILSCKKKLERNSPSSKPPVKDQHFKKDGEYLNTHLFLHGELVASPKQYKYSEIRRMTKSFGDKLGEGGFGTVFKGILPDGHLVAVKVLNEAKGKGEDFINEVASISRTSHVNIVSLLGYCMEKKNRTLVYEYMPNGSLDKYIFSDKSETVTILGWNKLYEIAIGIARGLEYLHRGCNTRIVHFDIKPHNILLDNDFRPKISDFGLAKLSSPLKSNISMVAARGTAGYIAPEVFSRNFGVVSTKSDVYSYGMMVLEMVGGRKNIDATADNSSEIYFPHWIHDHVDFYCQSKISEVTGEIEEKAKKMIIVSLWCIQTLPENRPSMSMVVSMLEGSIHDLQMPPKP